jgi:CDP-alcohol phosphatidyltransferase-like enzyme
MSRIEATYKARDVEETIDIYFYRPIGYLIAMGCRALRISPNVVTIVSIFIGVAGGHLLYYRDAVLNVWGVILWVVADTLDSVDGQLARMTDHKSRFGRILDGLGGNIIFISIYSHLFARMVVTTDVWWPLLVLFVVVSAMSHSVQSALADYYRNAYIKFVIDPAKSELDDSADVREELKSLSFRKNPVRKFMLRVYLNYTVEQEAFSKNFQNLRRRADREFGPEVPAWFSDRYRVLNKPLMKYYAILTTNIRMIIMAVCVVLDRVPLFFAIEIIGINLVMVAVTMYQERLSAELLLEIDQQRVPA